MFSGITHDFNPSLLSDAWSVCHRTTYNKPLSSTVVDSILNACSGRKLLLGCRLVNMTNLKIAAMGDRGDVLYDCGKHRACSHVANEVAWYFSTSYSWGFAKPGDGIDRFTCDIQSEGDRSKRLCWHTNNDSSYGGYRCGEIVELNNDATWERLIYHSS